MQCPAYLSYNWLRKNLPLLEICIDLQLELHWDGMGLILESESEFKQGFLEATSKRVSYQLVFQKSRARPTLVRRDKDQLIL